MSALAPEADMDRHDGNVYFVPKADSCTATDDATAPFGFCVAQRNAIVLVIRGHTRIVRKLSQGAIHEAARLNFSSSICPIECREFTGVGWDWLWPSGSGAGCQTEHRLYHGGRPRLCGRE